MTETKPDGGAAFPFQRREGPYAGITLRDWFAGRALPKAMDLDGAMIGDRTITHLEIAEYAYAIADAMLAARRP